jgi:hypothetical protein
MSIRFFVAPQPTLRWTHLPAGRGLSSRWTRSR